MLIYWRVTCLSKVQTGFKHKTTCERVIEHLSENSCDASSGKEDPAKQYGKLKQQMQ